MFDVYGRVVFETRVSQEAKAEFFWYGKDADGNDLPPGVYFCRFAFGDTTLTRKVTLLR